MFEVPILNHKPSCLSGNTYSSTGDFSNADLEQSYKTAAGSTKTQFENQVITIQGEKGKYGPANCKITSSPFITLGKGSDEIRVISQSSQSIPLPTSELSTPKAKFRASPYQVALQAFEDQSDKEASGRADQYKFVAPTYPKLDKRPPLPFPLIQIIPVPE